MPRQIVYMKAGTFASESLNHILRRKIEEYKTCGMFFWGYGGSICHPRTQVQPFARQIAAQGKRIYFLMSETRSPLRKPPNAAQAYSVDGNDWHPMPLGINVYGSSYALVCGEPVHCQLDLDMRDYVVALGPNEGRPLSYYIRSRVDKACAIWHPRAEHQLATGNHFFEKITLIAPIIPPYAVFLR